MNKKLSIIVPAYNEEDYQNILNKINETHLIQDIQKEIIVVNDCSKDNTEQKITEFQQAHPEQILCIKTRNQIKVKAQLYAPDFKMLPAILLLYRMPI